jgi:hypothetical protein
MKKQTILPHQNQNIWKHPLALIALVVVAYWLWSYHSQHLLGWLPYAILALCPLMHIFMHGGHGGHGNHSGHASTENKEDK